MNRLTIRNSEGIGVLKIPFECGRCGDLWWSLPDLGNGSPIERLAEYEDLEEQGRLLKLPCAVGDTVYYRYDGMKIAPMRVEEIIIAEYGTNLLLVYCGNDEKLKYWKINIESTTIDCKIIFLTREETEAALKEARKIWK